MTREAEPRTPESLTRLERRWLQERHCAWCEAPTHVNACYQFVGEYAPCKGVSKCTDAELNARRGRWLANDYKPRPKGGRALADRFWEKVDRRGPDECWPWTGARNRKGYGMIGVENGKTTRIASRVAWEIANGKPFPDDMMACHTCDNPCCVNPAHIWCGTNSDNIMDCISKGRHSTKNKTHCVNGHPFDGDNLHVSERGFRYCRTCRREAMQRFRDRQKEAV